MDLRQLRAREGLTRTEAAKYLGKSRSTLQRWENGESMPKTVFEFAKLAVLYKTTLKEAVSAWAESAANFWPDDIYERRLLWEMGKGNEIK